MNNRIH